MVLILLLGSPHPRRSDASAGAGLDRAWPTTVTRSCETPRSIHA